MFEIIHYSFLSLLLYHFTPGLRLPGITSESEITEQAATLCKEYVQNKLKRAGLITTNDLTKSRPKVTDTSRELQYVGYELEQLYPALFKDVCRQLNVNLTSETIVDEIFTEVSTELFVQGITWARVVAMFAVAGAIATECFQQGNVAYVNAVVNCLTNFVRNHLALWISQRGGWVGGTAPPKKMLKSYPNRLQSSPKWSKVAPNKLKGSPNKL